MFREQAKLKALNSQVAGEKNGLLQIEGEAGLRTFPQMRYPESEAQNSLFFKESDERCLVRVNENEKELALWKLKHKGPTREVVKTNTRLPADF
jgi:hypothetical protein